MASASSKLSASARERELCGGTLDADRLDSLRTPARRSRELVHAPLFDRTGLPERPAPESAT